MKLFISWSGERSKQLAQGLYEWLPGVINAVEPWISSNDIAPGARWGSELAHELEQTRYGIICVTGENTDAPWLMFEAGALSKYVEKSRVVPLLLDIKPTDIKGPLAQFQAIQTTESGIRKLVTAINSTVFDVGEKGMNNSFIDESFRLWWPQLKLRLDNLPKAAQGVKQSRRNQQEITEEILILVRKMYRELNPVTQKVLSEWVDDVPPPPDNFPDNWETQWMPSFEDAITAAKTRNRVPPQKSS